MKSSVRTEFKLAETSAVVRLGQIYIKSKSMNLISDLGNDLAMAFFINKQHDQKVDKKEFLALMNKVREELNRISLKKERAKRSSKINFTLSSSA